MTAPRPLFDAHLDLAWCALYFNRDLTLDVSEIRQRERQMNDEPARGRNTLSLPELRAAGVRVCVATLLARGGPEQAPRQSYKRTDLDYVNPTHAHAIARGQLAYYEMLEAQGHIRLLRTRDQLDAHWSAAQNASTREGIPQPLGVILSMEGADPIVAPEQVWEWWNLGLRAVGPAHYGRGVYAYGTGVSGPLGNAGRALVRKLAGVGMSLDVTHLCDESMAEALDLFEGAILASHHNCRSLVPGDRQLTDGQIRALVKRGAVIGVALDAWMLYPGWVRGQTRPEVVGLEAVADQIDHVCQLAGSVNHSAIGTDLDGGFGAEQTPRDLNTYRDLHKLDAILQSRGYNDAEIDQIFHGNWLRFFRAALPMLLDS